MTPYWLAVCSAVLLIVAGVADLELERLARKWREAGE